MTTYWNNRARALPWGTDPTYFEVRLGRRSWAVLELFESTVLDGSGVSYSVTFHTSPAGVRVAGFAVDDQWGPGLTAKRLRSARYADLIRQAFENRALELAPDGTLAADGFSAPIELRDLTGVIDPTRRPRGRPKTTDEGDFQRAADLYRQAQAEGRPTTAAVAQGLGVSASTARKRVMGARERGLLPKVNGYTRPSARMGPAEREAVLSGLLARD